MPSNYKEAIHVEFVCVVLIFLAFVSASIYSTMREINSEKKASKWSFHVPVTNSELINPVDEINKFMTNIHPTTSEVELSDYTDVLLNVKSVPESIESGEISSNLDIANFQHSSVNDELMISLGSLIQSVNEEIEQGNDTTLSVSIIESIKEHVGPNVSKLVTNTYSNLTENTEAVVMGLYCSESNTLSFLGEKLHLTGDEDIVSGEDDYVLVKGMLLPSKEFRVLHYEDADTVEIGYGKEQFIIKKVA